MDILTVGTRHPGAANVFRTVGSIPGIVAFVADVLKTTSVVVLMGYLPAPEVDRLVASVMLIIGT